MREKTSMHVFDGMTILISEQYNTRAAYEDIMASLRYVDVDDVIRESPAFVDSDDAVNH